MNIINAPYEGQGEPWPQEKVDELHNVLKRVFSTIEVAFKIDDADYVEHEFRTTYSAYLHMLEIGKDCDEDLDRISIKSNENVNILPFEVACSNKLLNAIIPTLPKIANNSRTHYTLPLRSIHQSVEVIFDYYEGKWTVAYIDANNGSENLNADDIISAALQVLYGKGTCVLIDKNLNEFFIKDEELHEWTDEGLVVVPLKNIVRGWVSIL